MKISTQIDDGSKIIGEEKTVEYIAKAGFDAWDFSMFSIINFDWQTRTASWSNHPLAGDDYLKFARRLKQIGLDNGIVCNQSHAPFPTLANQQIIMDSIKRAIECTAEAGGKICVVHPDNNGTAKQNAEMYMPLIEFGRKCGVKVATENMWDWDNEENHASFAACATPESFLEHFEAVNNDDYLVACLDIGHAEMKGLNTSAVDMINKLGHHLQALHIHDNDKWHDSHQIPFSMNIDFEPIVKALKDNGYKGYFTLEADNYLHKFNKDNIFEGIKDLQKAARRLADMYEAM